MPLMPGRQRQLPGCLRGRLLDARGLLSSSCTPGLALLERLSSHQCARAPLPSCSAHAAAAARRRAQPLWRRRQRAGPWARPRAQLQIRAPARCFSARVADRRRGGGGGSGGGGGRGGAERQGRGRQRHSCSHRHRGCDGRLSVLSLFLGSCCDAPAILPLASHPLASFPTLAFKAVALLCLLSSPVGPSAAVAPPKPSLRCPLITRSCC